MKGKNERTTEEREREIVRLAEFGAGFSILMILLGVLYILDAEHHMWALYMIMVLGCLMNLTALLLGALRGWKAFMLLGAVGILAPIGTLVYMTL